MMTKAQANNSGLSAARHHIKSPWVPFVLLWLFMTVCHMFFKLGTGDDPMYAAFLDDMGLVQRLTYFYQNWSARTLVEAVPLVVNRLPGLVWRLANPLAILLVAVGMARILDITHNGRACWYLCGSMLLYPWQVMSSAGWITTTTIYLWPFAAMLWAFVPVARLMRRQRVGLGQCIASLLMLLYAGQMEQATALSMAVLVGILAYSLLRWHRVHWLVPAQIAITLGNILWILTSPGFQARYEIERASWLPTIGMKPLLSKLELGFSLAFNEVIFSRSILFFMFVLLVALVIFQRYNSMIYRCMALVPVVVVGVLGMYAKWSTQLFPALTFFTEALQADGIISLANANALLAYIPLVVLYGTFGLCVVNLYLAIGHGAESLFAIYGLGAGLGSYVMLGFSPTVRVSGPRVGFFFMMMIMMVSALLGKEVVKKKGVFEIIFFLVFVVYCLLQMYSIQEMRIATGY